MAEALSCFKLTVCRFSFLFQRPAKTLTGHRLELVKPPKTSIPLRPGTEESACLPPSVNGSFPCSSLFTCSHSCQNSDPYNWQGSLKKQPRHSVAVEVMEMQPAKSLSYHLSKRASSRHKVLKKTVCWWENIGKAVSMHQVSLAWFFNCK